MYLHTQEMFRRSEAWVLRFYFLPEGTEIYNHGFCANDVNMSWPHGLWWHKKFPAQPKNCKTSVKVICPVILCLEIRFLLGWSISIKLVFNSWKLKENELIWTWDSLTCIKHGYQLSCVWDIILQSDGWLVGWLVDWFKGWN